MLLYIASGFAVGMIVGFSGVGGGSLMTPLLVLLFGFHPATAVGTDLLYAAITKTGGTFVHGFRRNVDWHITGFLAAGSLPASALTLLYLRNQGVMSPTAAHVISIMLGVALLLTSASLITRRWIMDAAAKLNLQSAPVQRRIYTVMIGAALGVLVSISSVGAGALGVTVLILLYPELPTVRIVGTDIAHAVPLTLVAGLGHWLLGTVDWPILLSLIIGSLPGIVLGSALAPRLPDRWLRRILAVVLFIVGARLVFA